MSDFYERLRQLAPADIPQNSSLMVKQPFRSDHIGMAADSFAHAMGENTPKDTQEMRDMLYVFGYLLDGELQKRLNYLTDIELDRLRYSIRPTTTVVPAIKWGKE